MMKLAVALLFCVAAVSARKFVPFGIVENVADCGSAGILQFVAVTDCTMAPCDLKVGTTYDIDVVFVASLSTRQLTLNIKVKLQNGDEHVVASVPVTGEIVGGQQFTISFGLPITNQFAGQSMLIWFELIDNLDDRLEICATASANIIP